MMSSRGPPECFTAFETNSLVSRTSSSAVWGSEDGAAAFSQSRASRGEVRSIGSSNERKRATSQLPPTRTCYPLSPVATQGSRRSVSLADLSRRPEGALDLYAGYILDAGELEDPRGGRARVPDHEGRIAQALGELHDCVEAAGVHERELREVQDNRIVPVQPGHDRVREEVERKHVELTGQVVDARPGQDRSAAGPYGQFG